MSAVTIIAIVMGVLIALFILAGFFLGFLKIFFPNFNFWVKYKVKKKQPTEEDVEFIIDFIEEGNQKEKLVYTALLTNKYSPKKISELVYLFPEIEKSLKGGQEKE